MKKSKIKTWVKNNQRKPKSTLKSRLYYLDQNVIKNDLHLLGGGMAKFDRQAKGKTWSKTNPIIKVIKHNRKFIQQETFTSWKTWGRIIKTDYKIGIIPKHLI